MILILVPIQQWVDTWVLLSLITLHIMLNSALDIIKG